MSPVQSIWEKYKILYKIITSFKDIRQRLDDFVRRLQDSPIAGSNLKQSTELRILAESPDEVRSAVIYPCPPEGVKIRKYGDPTEHVTEYYSEVLMRRRNDGFL